MSTLTPTASAMHQQYVASYNKWLRHAYPDKYGSWTNRGPIRRGVKKWGSKLGQWYLVYEGLKEAISTGDIPTNIGEREDYRASAIKQFTIDTTPKIIYKDGLAVGFEAPEGSNIDMDKIMPYQAAVEQKHEIPEYDEPQLEWIDPMDEWWPVDPEHVYEQDPFFKHYLKKGASHLWNEISSGVKEGWSDIKYVTPPHIRKQIGSVVKETARGTGDVLKWGWNPKKYPLGDDDPNKEGYQ